MLLLSMVGLGVLRAQSYFAVMAWQLLSMFNLGLMRLEFSEFRTRQNLRANHSIFRRIRREVGVAVGQ